jgi:hypothetical protein
VLIQRRYKQMEKRSTADDVPFFKIEERQCHTHVEVRVSISKTPYNIVESAQSGVRVVLDECACEHRSYPAAGCAVSCSNPASSELVCSNKHKGAAELPPLSTLLDTALSNGLNFDQ